MVTNKLLAQARLTKTMKWTPSSQLLFRVSFAMIIILGFVGCTGHQPDRERRERNDRKLAERVARALEHQPVYKYPDVKVHSFDGVVQLSGFVVTDAQKEAVNEVVQRVRGVGQVQNNILVAPPERQAVRDYLSEPSGTPSSGSRTASGSATNRIQR